MLTLLVDRLCSSASGMWRGHPPPGYLHATWISTATETGIRGVVPSNYHTPQLHVVLIFKPLFGSRDGNTSFIHLSQSSSMSSCMVCNFLTSCLPVSNHATGTWAVTWPSNRSAGQIWLASAHWPKYSSLLFTIEQFLGGAYALLRGSIYCFQGFSVFVPWVSQSSVWPAHRNAALPCALGALSSFPLSPYQSFIKIPCFQLLGGSH